MRLLSVVVLLAACRHTPPTPPVEAAVVLPAPAPVVVDPVLAEIERAVALPTGDATAALRALLRTTPDHPAVLHALAHVMTAADLPGAELVTARAQALAPTADHHNSQALAALGVADPTRAVQELKAALALDADHFHANMNLGWLALDSGDFAMARVCFERVVPTGDPDARLGLAVALRGEEDLDGAEALYAALRTEDPTRALAAVNHALLVARHRGDLEGAKAILDTYVGDDARVAALRVDVDSWLAEAESRRIELQAAESRLKAQRKAHKAALAELKERLPAWATEAGDDLCRARLVEQAPAVLELEDGELAADVLAMWDACQE